MMHFSQTSVTTVLALAGLGLALPADRYPDVFTIATAASGVVPQPTPSCTSSATHNDLCSRTLTAENPQDVITATTWVPNLLDPYHSPTSPTTYDDIAGRALPAADHEDAEPTTIILPPKPAIISQTFPVDPTPTPDTTMLEERSGVLHKLREGKCTGVSGQCRVRVKGIPLNKACEDGTRCSAKGSRCFLSGRTWLRYHVTCA